MDYLGEPYEDDGYMFVLGRFPATPDGAEAARVAEQAMSRIGYIVVAVGRTESELDVGSSLVQSGIGLGLGALTGIGFLRAARKSGSMVVKFGLANRAALEQYRS